VVASQQKCAMKLKETVTVAVAVVSDLRTIQTFTMQMDAHLATANSQWSQIFGTDTLVTVVSQVVQKDTHRQKIARRPSAISGSLGRSFLADVQL